MLEAKRNADAMHHGGLTGCGVDPGPQGVGNVRKIVSIGNMCMCIQPFILIASLLCV